MGNYYIKQENFDKAVNTAILKLAEKNMSAKEFRELIALEYSVMMGLDSVIQFNPIKYTPVFKKLGELFGDKISLPVQGRHENILSFDNSLSTEEIKKILGIKEQPSTDIVKKADSETPVVKEETEKKDLTKEFLEKNFKVFSEMTDDLYSRQRHNHSTGGLVWRAGEFKSVDIELLKEFCRHIGYGSVKPHGVKWVLSEPNRVIRSLKNYVSQIKAEQKKTSEENKVKEVKAPIVKEKETSEPKPVKPTEKKAETVNNSVVKSAETPNKKKKLKIENITEFIQFMDELFELLGDIREQKFSSEANDVVERWDVNSVNEMLDRRGFGFKIERASNTTWRFSLDNWLCRKLYDKVKENMERARTNNLARLDKKKSGEGGIKTIVSATPIPTPVVKETKVEVKEEETPIEPKTIVTETKMDMKSLIEKAIKDNTIRIGDYEPVNENREIEVTIRIPLNKEALIASLSEKELLELALKSLR